MIYYLLTIVNNIRGIAMVFSIIFGVFLALITLSNIIDTYENIDDIKRRRYLQFNENSLRRKLYSRLNKISVILFAIFLSLAVFLPSPKGIAFIYVAPKLIENDNVKETFANIPELAKLGTDYLKELLKEKVNDRQRDSNSF